MPFVVVDDGPVKVHCLFVLVPFLGAVMETIQPSCLLDCLIACLFVVVVVVEAAVPRIVVVCYILVLARFDRCHTVRACRPRSEDKSSMIAAGVFM